MRKIIEFSNKIIIWNIKICYWWQIGSDLAKYFFENFLFPKFYFSLYNIVSLHKFSCSRLGSSSSHNSSIEDMLLLFRRRTLNDGKFIPTICFSTLGFWFPSTSFQTYLTTASLFAISLFCQYNFLLQSYSISPYLSYIIKYPFDLYLWDLARNHLNSVYRYCPVIPLWIGCVLASFFWLDLTYFNFISLSKEYIWYKIVLNFLFLFLRSISF